MNGLHNLGAFLIAAGMVCFCAVLKLDRENFNSVTQLAASIVSGVAGAMVGHRLGVVAGRAQATKERPDATEDSQPGNQRR